MNSNMNKIIDFVRSRVFLVNIALSTVVVLILVFFTYLWLNSFTNHGETVKVPDLKGMKFSRLESLLEGSTLKVVISDSSVFVLDKPAGIVIDQDPPANEEVKEGRTIYVTITRSVPPQVKLPNLSDVSKRQAEAILFSYGLKTGDVSYQPDVAKDVVLAVRFKGRELKVGDEIPKGSVLELVLGDGLGNTSVDIPNLVGLTLDEALFVLRACSLKTGAVEFEGILKDSSDARVFRQIPSYGDTTDLQQGDQIDLFLMQSR